VRHILGSVGAGISGDRADQAGGPVVKRVEGVNVAGDRLDQFFSLECGGTEARVVRSRPKTIGSQGLAQPQSNPLLIRWDHRSSFLELTEALITELVGLQIQLQIVQVEAELGKARASPERAVCGMIWLPAPMPAIELPERIWRSVPRSADAGFDPDVLSDAL
jgi:hypothetical protein